MCVHVLGIEYERTRAHEHVSLLCECLHEFMMCVCVCLCACVCVCVCERVHAHVCEHSSDFLNPSIDLC